MAKQDAKAAEPSAEVTEEEVGLLDSILSKVNVSAPTTEVDVGRFSDPDSLVEEDRGATVAAALSVFIEAVSKLGQPVEQIDKQLLDGLVAGIDNRIGAQLDEILHNESFQRLESAWKGLRFLVDRTDFRRNAKVELLNVSKDALRESFEEAPELIQSPLYKTIYTKAYDTAGGNPYAAIVGNYEFTSSPQDVALLSEVSKVSATAHCPFISAIGAQFFQKENMTEWKKIPDLEAYMDMAEFAKWNSFRESEDARYVGLTLPRFLLRLPYGEETVKAKNFNYEEEVASVDQEKYLWGNAAFAFAANMVAAFAQDGWSVQIRGPESGGLVQDLPVHVYDVGKGKQLKTPTEVPVDDTLELTAANLGFIPMTQYQGRDYSCFFSANSGQKAKEYDSPEATANSRINARLPYIMLASRIAHYLKVMQRQNIGATKDKLKLEGELNRWLNTLVTEMPDPSPAQIARYPLRAGSVRVFDVEGNPGYFRVETAIMPHFQIEGMDISLSLVGKMPTE